MTCVKLMEGYLHTRICEMTGSLNMFEHFERCYPSIPIHLAQEYSYIKMYHGDGYRVINYFVDADTDYWYLLKNGKITQTIKFTGLPRIHHFVIFNHRLWERMGKYTIKDSETGKVWNYLNFKILMKKLYLVKLIT